MYTPATVICLTVYCGVYCSVNKDLRFNNFFFIIFIKDARDFLTFQLHYPDRFIPSTLFLQIRHAYTHTVEAKRKKFENIKKYSLMFVLHITVFTLSTRFSLSRKNNQIQPVVYSNFALFCFWPESKWGKYARIYLPYLPTCCFSQNF